MDNQNIKEILDILKKCKDYDDEVYLIKQHGAKLLLDYITNLQTIEQQYSALLSENAELENKITNLQEENERLKGIINQAIAYNKTLCEIYDCGMELSNAETNLCILNDEKTLNILQGSDE